ncbi:MAG TPA: hypothetical protein V6C64_08410 [Microcoleaceae cyanobacterium]
MLGLASMAMVSVPVSLLTDLQSAQAQTTNCIYLQEVTTGQTSIQKTVSAQGLGHNNWNTDFMVPVGTVFRYFVGRVYPQNTANYQVAINLKYNNNTYSEVFSNSIPMQRFQLYSKSFWTPTYKQPYQVNMNIGSDINNVYSVAVLGCK